MKPKTHAHYILGATFKRVGIITVIDAAFFSLTDPSANNSVIIIVGVGLLSLSVYYWSALAARGLASFRPMSIPSQHILAGCLASAMLFLVLMQSIGQLGWGDVLAVLPLAGGLYMYLSYRTRSHLPEAKV